MRSNRNPGQRFATLVKLVILGSFLLLPLVALGQSAMTGIVNRNANLRSGPGTTYAVTGKAAAGEMVTIVDKNTAGDWYQLDNKAWIAAFLVDVTKTVSTPTPALSATPTFTSTLPITATLIKSITTTLTIPTATIPTATLPTATMPTATVSPSTTFTATGLSGQLAQVTSVSNGDTIKVLLNGVAYKVRYIMVSAPSTKQPLFQ
ncbi:MAG: SH3 domain-containing protein, partial [Chloroflexi bacterium]|nr:SH3 domain-containing protein [Chloroflexota bacterium]